MPREKLQDAQDELTGQYLEYSAKLSQLDTDIERYDGALSVAREREKIYERLLSSKDVSRDAWLDKKQDRVNLEGQLNDAQDSRKVLIAQTRLLIH